LEEIRESAVNRLNLYPSLTTNEASNRALMESKMKQTEMGIKIVNLLLDYIYVYGTYNSCLTIKTTFILDRPAEVDEVKQAFC
jgi:hypothetical protein